MRKYRLVEIDASEPTAELEQRLEVRDEVGAGGMGVVREVFDHNLLQPRAIKLLHDDLAKDVNSRRRMIEEAQITAQLDHPNIVPVHEVGALPDGNLYFTMKHVHGTTLAQLTEKWKPARRTERELLLLLQHYLKVCDALAFAHSHGVIHRDLKTSNIMVGDFGEVYLMDWGLARLTGAAAVGQQVSRTTGSGQRRERVTSQDGQLVGTPFYMSPEQARGQHERVDQRSDIFSMGAILYEILVGQPPYSGATPLAALFQAGECEVRPPREAAGVDLPRKLCDVAMKAMARDPADRYQTVQELKADLERFIQSGWQFETRELAPDTVIIREGDRGDTAYIIVRGRCRVTRQVEGKQVTLAELGPGELFGETAVFADQPRSSTVTAIGPVTLRVVPRQHFDELWEGTALGRFVQALARRFNDSSQQASELESDLEVWMMFARIFKFLALSGETAADGRREARWSALREILMAQLNRPEDWILEVIQTDPMVQVDIGRDVISVGTIF